MRFEANMAHKMKVSISRTKLQKQAGEEEQTWAKKSGEGMTRKTQ